MKGRLVASVASVAGSSAERPDGIPERAAAVCEEIARRDTGRDGLHAFLAHDPDGVRRQAEDIAQRLSQAGEGGGVPSLAGVPIAVKDNLCTLDLPTTCGSALLEGFRPPYEATVVRRLREAGALVVGKTNMDEFAMGSSTEYSAWGATRNPRDPDRIPGGSSGGSAAAVAAGLVPAALGSDTGGSVRQPAALCGVVGLKPTYGAVSRYGLVAFASSLDQVGVFGGTVADAVAVLEAIAGHDPRDATSARRPAPALGPALEQGVEGLVVGVPREYLTPDLHPGVRARVERAVSALEDAGAELRSVSLPRTGEALAAYHVTAAAEASSNLARFDGVRYGHRVRSEGSPVHVTTRSRLLGAEVKRRILLGTYVLAAGHRAGAYRRAQAVRAAVGEEFSTVFAGVDAILTPTIPRPATPLGDPEVDPTGMYAWDAFTAPANLAGVPAISVPAGLAQGLPVGVQVMAARWGEPAMIRVAAALERAG